MANKSAKKPRIRHMCSLGTLGGYGGKKEWSVPKKLTKIRKAGFDGFLGRVHMLSKEESILDSNLMIKPGNRSKANTTNRDLPEDLLKRIMERPS